MKIWIFDDSFNKKGPVLVILVPGMIQLKVTLFLKVRFIFSSPNLKTFTDLDGSMIPGTKITNTGPFLWNESSKIQIFIDFSTFSVRGC